MVVFPVSARARQGVQPLGGGWLRNPVRVAFAVREHELVESVLRSSGAYGRTLCWMGLRSVEV